MLQHDLGPDWVIRPVRDEDAEELDALVDANRAQLTPWMPWAAGQDLAVTRDFIRTSAEELEDGTALQLAIVERGAIVGMVGFHGISQLHASAEIGYWLAADRQGRGTMTAAVRALVGHGFSVLHLHRVEIQVAPENLPSRAIPERLAFVHEGTLREAQHIGERWLDSAVYGMLAADWPPAS
jgi:ribosomal-protein-serine acetyltransferase